MVPMSPLDVALSQNILDWIKTLPALADASSTLTIQMIATTKPTSSAGCLAWTFPILKTLMTIWTRVFLSIAWTQRSTPKAIPSRTLSSPALLGSTMRIARGNGSQQIPTFQATIFTNTTRAIRPQATTTVRHQATTILRLQTTSKMITHQATTNKKPPMVILKTSGAMEEPPCTWTAFTGRTALVSFISSRNGSYRRAASWLLRALEPSYLEPCSSL
mmetsp:Transcript_20661/g.44706  ORF Transcript_20661/g.44706 Transcript_20661/m.44706 type:complete len:218 (-) Transcript_20661:611-1264(-)